jgi:nitrous oxidase accessory protein
MNRIAFILLLLITGSASFAKTIKVGKSQSFHSVHQAIQAAVNGDTVLVEYGIYFEKNLLVNKSIVLRGINHPVLDGEKKYEIISVKASHVTVNGFTIIHSGISSMDDIAGIKLYDCHDVVIENNILEDTFFGIYTQNGTNCTIRNNQLKAYSKTEQQSGNGIHCWKCDNMHIIDNTVTGHRDGIYFEFVTNSVIFQNTSYHNIRYGLHFMFSHQDTYTDNIFKNNGSGVSVMFTHGVRMIHNYFGDNWGDAANGLLLKEISDSYIAYNHFSKNTSGIYMEGGSRILIEKNIFENNGWALKMQASCMDVTLTQNNFIFNTFDVGTNGTLMLNKIYKNYWDKYDGYDLDKNNIGDIPYRPISMYSMIVEKNPTAMILFRSLMASLLDKTEKVLPSLTPENLKDDFPLMKPVIL